MKMLLVNNIYIPHMLGKINEENNTYQGIYFLTDVHILKGKVQANVELKYFYLL